jgi:hypothetical protein
MTNNQWFGQRVNAITNAQHQHIGFCKEICVSGFLFWFCCCDFPRPNAR